MKQQQQQQQNNNNNKRTHHQHQQTATCHVQDPCLFMSVCVVIRISQPYMLEFLLCLINHKKKFLNHKKRIEGSSLPSENIMHVAIYRNREGALSVHP